MAKEQRGAGAPFEQQVLFFHGDKGGVGKSTTCIAVGDALLQSGAPFMVVDCDDRNPDVARIFGDLVPVQKIGLRTENGWMELIDLIDAHPDHHVLVSLPAGIGDHCAQHFPLFAEGVRRVPAGRVPPKVVVWWVINHYADSVNLLADQVKALDSSVDRWVVVRNLSAADGTPDAFFIWQESPVRYHLMTQKKCETVNLPALHLRVMIKLMGNAATSMPPSELVATGAGEVTKSEVMALEKWLRDIRGQFGPVMPALAAGAVVDDKAVA